MPDVEIEIATIYVIYWSAFKNHYTDDNTSLYVPYIWRN